MAEDQSWFKEYMHSLVRTPIVIKKRCLVKRAMLPSEKGEMKKSLGPIDLLFFGIGCIVGSGIFVTTGKVAATTAGPAVGFSYMVASFGALLSALCYAEFAVELRLAGSAFSYVMYTCGEFMAWITACNLLLEYVLSSAAVARAFSSYFATLCQQQPDFFLIPAGGYQLDFLAMGIVLLLVTMLCWSQGSTSKFNIVVTSCNLCVILFVIILGLTKSNLDNWNPFLPFGLKGVFDGAGLVFFSYIGFDAVATTAEEAKKPSRDLPFGIVGSVCIVTVIYFLMCCTISLMQPYYEIDIASPFPMAFSAVGLQWAATIVSLGASFGIITTLLVNLMGQSRIWCVIARENMLPSRMAQINPKTGTPVIATAVLGGVTAGIALVSSFDTLSDMVSIGTLLVFYIVSASLVFHRHYDKTVNKPGPVMGFLFLLTVINIGFACCWQLTESFYSFLILIPYLGVVTGLMFLAPQVRVPTQFGIPGGPYVPCMSMFMNVFIMSGLAPASFFRTGLFCFGVILIYCVYSVHASAIAASHMGNDGKQQDMGETAMLSDPSNSAAERTVSSYKLVRGPQSEIGLGGINKVDEEWRDDEDPEEKGGQIF